VSNTLYDQDLYAWTAVQADLLRSGRLSEVDLLNLAEEIESIGRSQKTELRHRLARVLQQLLKWRYQPDLRSRSWAATLIEQRTRLDALVADSPSLQPLIEGMLPRAYSLARLWTLNETGLLQLPPVCKWTAEQVLDPEFLPV
jgi:hypothetical protein